MKEPSDRQTNTRLIDTFVAALKAANGDTPLSVVLIGSAARNAATADSDLDLLVVGTDGIKMVPTPGPLHVQVTSSTEFRSRLKNGDDFAAWCVRFGIPIVRSSVWDEIVGSPEATRWPDWRQKIEHSARRLLLASGLRESGDTDATAEELLYAVSHLARAILLKHEVFPLSRPEMIAQLKESGFPDLARTLIELSFGTRNDKLLRRSLIYVKKLLVHLDRNRFKAYVDIRRSARSKKEQDKGKRVVATQLK